MFLVSNISDHLPILALVKNSKPYYSAPPTSLKRDTTNFRDENFLINLEDKLSELEKYFLLQTVHDSFQKFLNIISLFKNMLLLKRQVVSSKN